MISFDCDAWEDDVEDGRRQLAEYELYIYEPDCKSRALLSRPDALVLARPFADELAHLVQQYSVPRDGSTLAEMLRYTLADGIISLALAGPDNLVTHRLLKAKGFVLFQRVQIVQATQEEQIRDLLHYLHRIGYAARPEGVPDRVDLTTKCAGQHVLVQ